MIKILWQGMTLRWGAHWRVGLSWVIFSGYLDSHSHLDILGLDIENDSGSYLRWAGHSYWISLSHALVKGTHWATYWNWTLKFSGQYGTMGRSPWGAAFPLHVSLATAAPPTQRTLIDGLRFSFIKLVQLFYTSIFSMHSTSLNRALSLQALRPDSLWTAIHVVMVVMAVGATPFFLLSSSLGIRRAHSASHVASYSLSSKARASVRA